MWRSRARRGGLRGVWLGGRRASRVTRHAAPGTRRCTHAGGGVSRHTHPGVMGTDGLRSPAGPPAPFTPPFAAVPSAWWGRGRKPPPVRTGPRRGSVHAPLSLRWFRPPVTVSWRVSCWRSGMDLIHGRNSRKVMRPLVTCPGGVRCRALIWAPFSSGGLQPSVCLGHPWPLASAVVSWLCDDTDPLSVTL